MIVTCENCSSRFVVDPQLLQPRGRRVRCARCKTVWFQAPPEADVLSGDADMRSGDTERKQIFRRTGDAAAAADASPFAPPQRPHADQPPTADAAQDDDDFEAYSEPETQDDPAANSADDDADMPDLAWPRNQSARSGSPRRAQVPALYKERSPLLMAAGWAVLGALVLSAFGGLIFARETIASKLPATKPVYAAVGLDIKPQIIETNVAAYLKLETPPPPPADLRDGMLVQQITGTITNTANAPVKIPTLEGILRDRDNNELHRWVFSAEAKVLYPGQRAAFATEIVDMPQEAVEMELVFVEGKPPTSGFESSR